MSNYSTVDREPFQKLLVGAFMVQQSSQSLSAIVERLVTREDLDVDGTTHPIVDRTRNVANATGVAIGPPEDEPTAADSMDACFPSFRSARPK